MNVVEKLINSTKTFLDHFQSNDRNSRLKKKEKGKFLLIYKLENYILPF